MITAGTKTAICTATVETASMWPIISATPRFPKIPALAGNHGDGVCVANYSYSLVGNNIRVADSRADNNGDNGVVVGFGWRRRQRRGNWAMWRC